MSSDPRRWFRLYLGSAWMGLGVGWSNCGGRRGREGPPSAMLSGPLGPCAALVTRRPATCAALWVLPRAEHIRGPRSLSSSPDEGRVLRGALLPQLEVRLFLVSQPRSHIPTSRRFAFPGAPARFLVFPPGASRPEVRSAGTPSPGALGRRYQQVRHQPRAAAGARPAPRALGGRGRPAPRSVPSGPSLSAVSFSKKDSIFLSISRLLVILFLCRGIVNSLYYLKHFNYLYYQSSTLASSITLKLSYHIQVISAFYF